MRNREQGFFKLKRYFDCLTLFQINNPDRERDHGYYDEIIKARLGRMQANKDSEEARMKARNDLNNIIADYQQKYDTAKSAHDKLSNSLEDELKKIEKEIEKYEAEKKKIDEKSLELANKVGLVGHSLIRCLVQVRSFAATLKDGSSAYSPFASILERKYF